MGTPSKFHIALKIFIRSVERWMSSEDIVESGMAWVGDKEVRDGLAHLHLSLVDVFYFLECRSQTFRITGQLGATSVGEIFSSSRDHGLYKPARYRGEDREQKSNRLSINLLPFPLSPSPANL